MKRQVNGNGLPPSLLSFHHIHRSVSVSYNLDILLPLSLSRPSIFFFRPQAENQDTSGGSGCGWNSTGVIFHRRPTSRNCVRLAVVFGFMVGLEMCTLQFTKTAIEGYGELARTILKVLGILLMLVSFVFMVLISRSDNHYVVQIHSSADVVDPLLANQDDRGAQPTPANAAVDDGRSNDHEIDHQESLRRGEIGPVASGTGESY